MNATADVHISAENVPTEARVYLFKLSTGEHATLILPADADMHDVRALGSAIRRLVPL